MSNAHLKLVTPSIVKRTVTPSRRPNGDLRTREYLTEAEVERLTKAARGGTVGAPGRHDDPCGLPTRASGNHRCACTCRRRFSHFAGVGHYIDLASTILGCVLLPLASSLLSSIAESNSKSPRAPRAPGARRARAIHRGASCGPVLAAGYNLETRIQLSGFSSPFQNLNSLYDTKR
jgi:hypothetical protein